MNQEQFEAETGRKLISRDEFAASVSRAVTEGTPFATGKAGGSERAVLHYPIVLERERDQRRRRAFELSLQVKALPYSGLFPPTADFYRRFSYFYAERLGELDCLGLIPNAYTHQLELIEYHGFRGDLVDYVDQEPDRSIPANEDRCYLPSFRGKDVLLVCPFAEVLRERACESTFEAVWAKTGKPWFSPRSVGAVEFPYGFESATQERYSTALELLAEIETDIASREFDVALIAAGGLGIPLAAFVSRLGKVGISLGGHLQVVFGVFGQRWLERENWRRDYINADWIRVPDRYRPDMATSTSGLGRGIVPTAEDYW